MIVSISGPHGTGKSTIGMIIAEKLDLRYYSTGQAFRDLAQEMHMTLSEFTEHVEDNPNIDEQLDNKVIEIAKGNNVLIDSQIGGFLLASLADFKIYLYCPLKVRIRRMAERDNNNYEEKERETLMREKSELERFKRLYNIDLSNLEEIKKVHNIFINTEFLSIEEVVNLILQKINGLS